MNAQHVMDCGNFSLHRQSNEMIESLLFTVNELYINIKLDTSTKKHVNSNT